jgi:hypothetical protein
VTPLGWTTNDTPYKTKFEDTHVSIHFSPDTITYTEPTILPKLNKEPCIEALAIKILYIHHKITEIDIDDLETKLLQITTNLQISPPYIKTPPPTPEKCQSPQTSQMEQNPTFHTSTPNHPTPITKLSTNRIKKISTTILLLH